jgi:glutamyl-tRNA synthetase
MEITHVIRGEEWLPSLALHQQLYDAFEWQAPEFSHLPLIMNPVGKGKLSKRDGEKLGFPVFPLSWNESVGYKDAGYYPEAVINFLALLGWNSGTEQEIFSLEELVQSFTLERVHKAGAKFDPEKTKWYNQHYLQGKNNRELVAPFKEILLKNGISSKGDAEIEKVVDLIKERATFIGDFWELSDYFFVTPNAYDEKAIRKQWKEDTPEIMKQLVLVLRSIADFTSEIIETAVKEWIEKENYSLGKVMPSLRLVIVGEMKGPHIFDILEFVGKEETILRIEKAIEQIS